MKKLSFLFVIILNITLHQKSEAQTTTIQEDTSKAALSSAQSFAKHGNTKEAIKIYLRIIESQPDNKDAVRGWLIATFNRDSSRKEDNIKSLEELGKLYPKNTGIMYFKAFMEGQYGLHEESFRDFDNLIKIQPDSALNYIGKGQALYAMGLYEEAFNAFDRATSLGTKRPDIWARKVAALAKTGRFDDALLSANKGLELFPNSAVIIYNRACIYSLKGDNANALTDLKKAISLNPSLKGSARNNEDFKSLYDNEDFKNLIL